jgi:inosine-uridine nucleoside N-ribohydrolase
MSSSSIESLDIADGLKECLVTNGFTVDLLKNMPSTDLAIILGIDPDVAKLIKREVANDSANDSPKVSNEKAENELPT